MPRITEAGDGRITEDSNVRILESATASAAITEADDTLSSSAAVALSGSAAITEADDTLSANASETAPRVNFSMFNDMFNYMKL